MSIIKLILILVILVILVIIQYKYIYFTDFIIYDPTKKYKIPFLIHQTWKDYDSIPEYIKEIILQNKKTCSLFDFKFYDDTDCINFIKDNFDDSVLNTYLRINNKYSAARADLFRYCVLYILGGVYLDIKSVIKHDLASIIKPDDECILFTAFLKAMDIRRTLLSYEHYEQWALIFSPKHPYLRVIIDQIIYEVNNKIIIKSNNSKRKILNLTGPDVNRKCECPSNSTLKDGNCVCINTD